LLTYPRVLTFTAVFTGRDSPDIQSQTYDECIALSKNVKLTIITQKIRTISHENLTLVEIPKIFLPVLISTQRILAYLIATLQNRKNYDIVFTLTFRNHFLIPGIIAKIFLKKKLVMFIPGSLEFIFRKKSFQRKIVTTALGIADTLITPSERIINELEKNVGQIDRSKVRILNKPTNISFFKPSEKITTNNNILSVCRMIPSKGIEKIINSLPLVLQEIPDVKFIHVGPIQDKKYWESLKDLVTSLGCEKSVEFQGPIPFEKLPYVYNSSKIFILTSKSEGEPNVTKEAMSCGKPVILTPVGSIPDYVNDGINGFLIKNDDEPKELAEIIIRLLKE